MLAATAGEGDPCRGEEQHKAGLAGHAQDVEANRPQVEADEVGPHDKGHHEQRQYHVEQQGQRVAVAAQAAEGQQRGAGERQSHDLLEDDEARGVELYPQDVDVPSEPKDEEADEGTYRGAPGVGGEGGEACAGPRGGGRAGGDDRGSGGSRGACRNCPRRQGGTCGHEGLEGCENRQPGRGQQQGEAVEKGGRQQSDSHADQGLPAFQGGKRSGERRGEQSDAAAHGHARQAPRQPGD